MSIDLLINGNYEMTIYDKDGVEVSEEKEKEILGKLQKFEYIIGLSTKKITETLDSKNETLYTFELDPTDSDYSFEKA